MKKYFLHTFCFGFLFLGIFNAQDVHFSQYYFSPLTLNPANTGNFKGDYRFFGNYRSQWREISKAYNTFSAGGDINIFPKNLNFSGGFMILNDKSGGNLSVTKIMPSAAFHKKLFGFSLHAGLQTGVVIKAIDFYANSFPNQLNWNTGKFDNTLPNSETNVVQRHTYLDMNMGFAASRRFGKFEPDIGLAMFHLNKPKDSFLSEKNRLPVRQAYNAGVNYYFLRNLIFRLHTMYGFTTKASDLVSGVNVEYVLTHDVFFSNSVFAGFMWRDGFKRNSDAGIITAGLNYSHYTIGFSYDITFSQLKTSVDSKGAFEIAFIYRAKSTRLTRKTIPCERY